MERELIYSQEYIEFAESTPQRTREKLLYATSILETLKPIPTKFVKKLTNTDFYELRVSTDNEVRVILFAVDNENINNATRIVFLNGFIKKTLKITTRRLRKRLKF